MRRPIAVAVFLTLAAAAFALGTREFRDGDTVKVSGILARVGNEPFSRLVVTDAEGQDWYIAWEDEAVVALREQRRVSVAGVLRLLPLTLAGGREFYQRELTKVRLLE